MTGDNIARSGGRFEYFNISQNVRRDALSEFIDACAPLPKAFGWQYGPECVCNPRVNGDMELIYIQAGQSIVTINGERLSGRAGDVIFIPKFSFSAIDTCPDDPHENYWLHLDAGDIISAEGLRRLIGGPLLHPGLDRELVGLYRRLDAEFTLQESGSRLAIDALVKLILLRILRLCGRTDFPTAPQEAAPTRENRVRALLNNCVRHVTELRGALPVARLCEDMYVSPAYLRKVFCDQLGMSPAAFIHTVRMREAENMLLTTPQTITEIAAALAYSSPYHFSADFKRMHGISPSEYRARQS